MRRAFPREEIKTMACFWFSRRQLMQVLAAVTFLVAGVEGMTPVYAQTTAWPTRSVRIVVPFAVGGTTDLVARLLGNALTTATGQTFVIENKTGASGAIGAADVARAAPDGYTLLVGTASTHAISPHVNKLPYDTVKDFSPIIHLADADVLLLAPPSLGVKTMPELIALARSKPGTINYSSSGVGSIAHLTFEVLAAEAGISMVHVPYKGSGAAIPDLESGRVHLTIDAIPTGHAYVKGGRLIGIATTGPQRTIPEIPTIAETLPGFNVLSWFGLYGPRNMAPDLVQAINQAFVKAMQSPEIVERYKSLGIITPPNSASAFAAMAARDSARWEKVVRERNVKVD
jgi:tripartite-type tricarboxylate transporter receptor subunit TctC